MESMSKYQIIYERIKQKKYDNSKKGEVEFANDLKEVYGLQDNPKFSTLFDIAWDFGHAYGYAEVLHYFDEMVELIR
jgi:hypothetical protein